MTGSRKLGLLGGTFDPVHGGHLDAAEAARTSLGLDAVTFIPAHDPPHRTTRPRASAFHRFAMVSLAIAGRDGCRVSDVELAREEPSYTVNTLRHFHRHGWQPWQLFFILGADAFAEIATWREFPAILDAANYVVLARPGTTIDQAFARTPDLRARARPHDDGAPPLDAPTIFLVTAQTRDVSSSGIRARLAAGEPIAGLVPDAVAHHIAAHDLYHAADSLHD
jgi:nicotinate-nucleotide adenylyltransferase